MMIAKQISDITLLTAETQHFEF